MGFPRQEYWSGLSLPSPGDLPNPGIKPESSVSSALAGRWFTTEPPEKPQLYGCWASICISMRDMTGVYMINMMKFSSSVDCKKLNSK